MAYISMCKDETCPIKEKCYRYNAIVCYIWQTYSDFKYNNGCIHFWKMEQKPTKQIL